jgi:hypothetical protein
VAGAFFYCSKAGLQRRVVRVEGILDGSMYVGKPNHLYIQRNLNIKLFTATETALELLIEQIHTIWSSNKHVATVLSLDILGAFDSVNHIQLLNNLRKKQVPLWFVRTVRSFLSKRSTTIVVDGVETALQSLAAGVP